MTKEVDRVRSKLELEKESRNEVINQNEAQINTCKTESYNVKDEIIQNQLLISNKIKELQEIDNMIEDTLLKITAADRELKEIDFELSKCCTDF